MSQKIKEFSFYRSTEDLVGRKGGIYCKVNLFVDDLLGIASVEYTVIDEKDGIVEGVYSMSQSVEERIYGLINGESRVEKCKAQEIILDFVLDKHFKV